MAGAGAGSYTVHPFFANGHGEQCDVRSPKLGQIVKARVDYTLPPGVHVVTIQEAGKYALISSADALRATLRRGFDATRMVTKPPFNKADDASGWCRSDYMKFKHEIAKAFDVAHAYAEENPSKGDLYDFTISDMVTNVSDRDRLSFDDLIRKGDLPEYKGYFERLCDLYDARIHIRYPGESIADNRFTPISYMMDGADMFTGMDAGAGVIDSEIFSSLDRGTQVALTKRYTLEEMDPELLRTLYSASVYPTKDEISAYLDKPETQAKIKAVPNTTEPTPLGKTLVVLNRDFNRPLSKIIPDLVAKYEVTAEKPIVLYYPLCRVFSEDPVTKSEKKEVSIAKGMSLTAEIQGAGPMKTKAPLVLGKAGMEGMPKKKGGRRTYRKKKLRNQTRKRRQ